jgi:RNA polymerase sigma factor (sigma-70 family)
MWAGMCPLGQYPGEGPTLAEEVPMATLFRRLLHRLRQVSDEPASDAELLARFAQRCDENAFATLVGRHGTMVLNVCRRVLRDEHAAEDAFQAAFLVLARKSGSLRRPESVASWLYGVAYRVALKARGRVKQALPQADAPEPVDSEPDVLSQLTAWELLEVLEEEIQRLPEVCRLPVVLCCLEGFSLEESARRLGWSRGSVKGRLARGRKLLHQRLVKRGLSLSAALGVVETARGAMAFVPVGLSEATVRGVLAFVVGAADGAVSPQVIALATGVLQAMSTSKLKAVVVLLVLTGLAGAGVGWWGMAPGKDGGAVGSATAAERRPRPRRPDVEEEARSALLDKLKAERTRIAEVGDQSERKWSAEIIDARLRLVELVEELNAIPAAEENEKIKLLRADVKHNEMVVERYLQRGFDEKYNGVSWARQNIAKLRKQLAEEEKLHLTPREKRLQLRKQIVRLEEEIRLLERKRDRARDETERRREAVTERIHQLENAERPVADQDRSLRRLERKLDSLQGELRDLRQEVDRLSRQSRK